MKKIYTKPSLHAEKFAVEGIMTGEVPAEGLSQVTSLWLNGNEIEGTINFTNANTLESINYADFE